MFQVIPSIHDSIFWLILPYGFFSWTLKNPVPLFENHRAWKLKGNAVEGNGSITGNVIR